MRKNEIKIVAEVLAHLSEYNTKVAEEYLTELIKTAPALEEAYRFESLLSQEFALTEKIFSDLMTEKFDNQWSLLNKTKLGNTEDVWREATQQAQSIIARVIKQI